LDAPILDIKGDGTKKAIKGDSPVLDIKIDGEDIKKVNRGEEPVLDIKKSNGNEPVKMTKDLEKTGQPLEGPHKINKGSNKKSIYDRPIKGKTDKIPEGASKVPLVVPGQPIDMIVAGPSNSVP
jgi:hypothetical protein